jgi:hypothetical protein
METQKTNKLKKHLFPGLIFILLIFSSSACAQKVAFLKSSVVPAAEGTVKVKQDKNKNYAIEVVIVDLAEVERLQSSKQTYVVWIETERGNAENIGQLKSSTGFMSKQHKATLETVSSFKPVKLFITAEDGIDIRYPGKEIILTTDHF